MNPQQQGDNEPRQSNWFEDWSERTPPVSRIFLIVVVSFGLLDLLLGLSAFLDFCPVPFIFSFQLWRMVTSWVGQGSLLTLLFVVLSFATMGPSFEMKIGSVGLFVLMATLNIAINCIFLLFVFLMAFNPILPFSSFLGLCNGGSWPMLLSLITIDCLSNPEGSRRLLCLPWKVKNMFFPWVMIGLFALFTMGIPWNLIIGAAMGYAYVYGMLNFAVPSTARLQEWEEGMLRQIGHASGAVPTSMAVGFSSEAPLPTQAPQQSQNTGGSSSWVSSSGGDVFGRGNSGNNDTASSGSTMWSGSAHTTSGGGGGGGLSRFLPSFGGGSSEGGSDDARRQRAELLQKAVESRLSQSNKQRNPTESVSNRGIDSLQPGIKQLQEMGYSEEDATAVLLRTNGDIQQAIDILQQG